MAYEMGLYFGKASTIIEMIPINPLISSMHDLTLCHRTDTKVGKSLKILTIRPNCSILIQIPTVWSL